MVSHLCPSCIFVANKILSTGCKGGGDAQSFEKLYEHLGCMNPHVPVQNLYSTAKSFVLFVLYDNLFIG